MNKPVPRAIMAAAAMLGGGLFGPPSPRDYVYHAAPRMVPDKPKVDRPPNWKRKIRRSKLKTGRKAGSH